MLENGYCLRVMNIRGDFRIEWDEKERMVHVDARAANEKDVKLLNEMAAKGRKEAEMQLFSSDETWAVGKFKKKIEPGFRYVMRRKTPEAVDFFNSFKEKLQKMGYSLASKGGMLEVAMVPVKGNVLLLTQ